LIFVFVKCCVFFAVWTKFFNYYLDKPCLQRVKGHEDSRWMQLAQDHVHAGFYGGELLVPRLTTKLEDNLSDFHKCLFNISEATLHIWRPTPPSATWGHTMPWDLVNMVLDSLTNWICNKFMCQCFIVWDTDSFIK
jgi:hypothetical protein